jgi:hypothetical protein
MQTRFDVARFRVEIGRITESIIALKRLLRTTWTRPMADEQRELEKLKLRATELCSLRAFSRGRFHLRHGPGPDWNAEAHHRRIAERLGPSFAIAVEVPA